MDSVKWYYLDAGQQQGPTNTKNLRGLLSSGELPPGTMVWASNLADWQPANTIGIFKQSKTPRLPHWLVTFLLVFISVLVLGFGGKYLTNKKNQTALPTDMIMDKRIANPYKNEASLLLPRDNTQNSQRKREQALRNRHQTRKPIPKPLSIIPSTPSPNPPTMEKEESSKSVIVDLQTENKILAKQVMELKATQGDPLAKTKLLRLTQQLNQLKEDYLESEKENQSLQNKLQLDQQQAEFEFNTQRKKDLEEMKTDLAIKNHHVDMLEEQLAILRDSLNKLQRISPTTHTSPPQCVGRIASLQINKGILVFNLTTTTKVSNGETLYIKSKTSGEDLGKATVSQTYGSKCVAKFEGENISRLNLGDHLLRQVSQ